MIDFKNSNDWLAAIPEASQALESWLTAGMSLWDDVQQMGQAIKEASHTALSKDLPRAEQLGRSLIVLGEMQQAESLIALGEMALGDALRLQMRYHEGCNLLDQAAERFLRLGDEVGWARTRIGWLGNVHHLPSYPAPEPIVERAVEIFTRHKAWRWLSTLCYNYAYHYSMLGDLSEWLHWCLRAREAAEQIENQNDRFLPLVLSLTMLISIYNDLGFYESAELVVADTLQLFEGHEHVYFYVDFMIKAGRFYLDTGRYTQALFYLYKAHEQATSLWGQYLADIMIAIAYLRLNRLDESENRLHSVLQKLAGEPNLIAFENTTRVCLAHVYNSQERWQEGLAILTPAIHLMEAQQKPSLLWLSRAYQHQALQLYHLRQPQKVMAIASKSIELAEKAGETQEVMSAYMVAAEVAESDSEAEQWLARAGEMTGEIPSLRWRVHQLTAARTSNPQKRQESLIQAANDLDQVQSSLAASFHADYLADAQALYDELIALYLTQNEVALAWQTLERAKSRALINTMMYQQEISTPADSPLMVKLKHLQLRHYSLLKGQMEGRVSRLDVQAVEKEMARVQETIEIEWLGRREPLTVPPPYMPLAPAESDLIGFYLVGEEVHGFVHNGSTYHHARLPATASLLNNLMRALFVNMRTTPRAPTTWMRALTEQLDKLLAQFDRALLAPLRSFLKHEKLVVVPHGLLHQLPFHLLRHQKHYLLEKREVRVVPTARLTQNGRGMENKGLPIQSYHFSVNGSAGRAASVRQQALAHVVVSDNWDGQLPHTGTEGEMVAQLLGNTQLLSGENATKEKLLQYISKNGGVLHIAAHGEHRPDRPELSHIQLKDGQLSMVDLFQRSLHYSLVTLSACDTGQAVIRAGDDPVGLWRGFLAAGARTLLVSLWQLEDQSALKLMRNFYEKLMAGLPKVAALRSVQQEWLANAEGRLQHPFYWGGLQLIGDDGLLVEEDETKEEILDDPQEFVTSV
jgi:CHAT domain-containing protein